MTKKRTGKSNLQPRRLSSLSEDEFKHLVAIPLLAKLGARNIIDTCGPDEDGKDLVFLFRDLDDTDQLHVCQIKNSQLTGRSGQDDDYTAVMRQLQKAKDTDVPHPITKISQQPERVWLISGWPIPHQNVLRAQTFMHELRTQGINPAYSPRLRGVERNIA